MCVCVHSFICLFVYAYNQEFVCFSLADDLAKKFSWLGFRVLMFKDLTVNEMQQTLECFSSLKDPSEKTLTELQESNVKEWSRDEEEFTDLRVENPLRHSDAFVCCVMSHGQKGSVFGSDGNALLVDDITSTFNGKRCPVLLNKPKVFIIQACQGQNIQEGIAADSSTPVDADFLVFMATTENNKAWRNPKHGSWFIQSLCKQLEEASKWYSQKHILKISKSMNIMIHLEYLLIKIIQHLVQNQTFDPKYVLELTT